MDRFQFVTKAECPDHRSVNDNRLWVVLAVDENGGLDVWKGCQWCPDARARLKAKQNAEVAKS